MYSNLSEFQSLATEEIKYDLNIKKTVIKYSDYADSDLEDFQYVNHFLKHLPYFDKIKVNAFNEFEQIKSNLAKSIILNEIRPGLVHWTNRLQTFINEYEIIYTPDVDLVIVDLCFSILVELLKKFYLLTREDLVIDWKPIYKLYLRISKIDERSPTLSPENIEQISFLNFVSFARIYFDKSATQEMLEEWRPLMCPFDMSMSYAFERFNLFLPTIFLEHELHNGARLWLKEFLDLWFTFSAKSFWESNIINLFARVAKDSVGTFDWGPYIPYVFSKTLRGLGLSLAAEFSLNIDDSTPKESLQLMNDLAESFAYAEIDIDSIGSWIVSMIGTSSPERNICMNHIKRLFQILRSYYYPSKSGALENFFSILQRIPEALIERIRFEKLKKYEWLRKGRNPESFIKDSDVEELVLCMKDLVLTALFSKTNFNDAIKTYQYLCFLRPDIMLPPLISQIYICFESLTEPHRYTPLLACLVSVPRELVTNPESQKHVIQLLISVLPGIDINDLNKFILTFQFLSNILSNVIVCDCSPAIQIRDDLNESERELCALTSKFEDFINELFKKLFNFVQHLANDTSSDSSASAAQAASYYSRDHSTVTDENVTQVHVVQMLKVLVSQSSRSILKLITKKVLKFINGSSFNIKAGDILAYLVGFLVGSNYGKEAFEKFFDHVYGNLIRFKESKNYNTFLTSEKGDNFILWNLHLLSYLLKANGPILVNNSSRIKELIQTYRCTTNKDTILHLTSCYNNLISSLTKIYPKETCSIGYNICFKDENQFFSKHLPIRDWGSYIGIKELNIEYHIPSSEEISVALEIVNSSINESMSLLRKSILNNKLNESKHSNKVSKEENYRELNYIYHLIYGASCLLKRPSKRPFVTEHIDSVVSIGLKQNVNKGLGFEIENVNDENHEYSSLSEENKTIMLNLREILIEFILKLVDKLVDDKSSDTIMLILISRILVTSCSIYGMFPTEFEKSWKNHFVNKSTIQNKLLSKKYPREELIRRVMLQYSYRCFHLHISLIDLDFKVINSLSNLSINSFYEIVRDEARNQLFDMLGQYPYSALTLLPNIIKFLNKTHTDKKFTKEQLEGCLLLLKGNNTQTSMLVKQNWFVLGKLWPALFKCKYFEKETVQKLLDKIYFNANLNFNSFNNRVKLNEACVSLAYELSSKDLESFASEELRLKMFNHKCSYENQLISNLMQDLISIADDSNITWKNQEISLFSLIFLLDSCQSNRKLLTADCVELFVKYLIHENKNFRRIAIDALCIIMKMVKHKKETRMLDTIELISDQTNNKIEVDKIEINKFSPGYRLDNSWHLYDPNFVNTSITENELDSKKWQETPFLDKSYWGYYCWPRTLKVNLNKRSVYSQSLSQNDPNLDYFDAIKPIRDKFQNDSEFVNKFIKLSLIEESKGNEKFDKKKFYLFKSLFRNFGNSQIFNNLYEHLKKLITDKDNQSQEVSHKLAAELLSGLIRGSKYWHLNDLKQLWTRLKSIFDLVMENISQETLFLWIDCFSNSFEDQDPRRMTFYLNYLQDYLIDVFYEINKLKSDMKQKPSFKQTNFLQILTCLGQFEWRIPLFWSNILDSLVLNMGHSYKLIREITQSLSVMAISSELTYNKKFLLDSSYNCSNPNQEVNNLFKIISLIESKLNQSIDLHDLIHDEKVSAESKKELKRTKLDELLTSGNFFQSLINWFILFITKSLEPFNQTIIKLLPMLCKIDKLASWDESLRAKLATIRMFLPIWNMDRNLIHQLANNLKEISKSENWRSKEACVQVLKNSSLFNIFLLKDEAKETLKQILLELIVDDQLQVRLSACVALTGLLHSNFIITDQSLINYFKNLSKTEAKSKDSESGKMILNASNLSKRHGGLLGLCSIVNSCPFDVPKYLPDVVVNLCQFINDPDPIQKSVKKCLNEFKRTHNDNWQEHKLAFDEIQLSTLSDILISPSYYA